MTQRVNPTAQSPLWVTRFYVPRIWSEAEIVVVRAGVRSFTPDASVGGCTVSADTVREICLSHGLLEAERQRLVEEVQALTEEVREAEVKQAAAYHRARERKQILKRAETAERRLMVTHARLQEAFDLVDALSDVLARAQARR